LCGCLLKAKVLRAGNRGFQVEVSLSSAVACPNHANPRVSC
jgi:hypothetical protein